LASVEGEGLLEALRARDEDVFGAVVDRYRRELLAHCYRMLGSFEDAEDGLQETLLRAWRGVERFEGRSTVRAWLYKIATNVCLDVLASRRRRALPSASFAAADPRDPLPGPIEDSFWVEPIPDALIDLRPGVNPDARYEARESVALTFLAALQVLPGRQRAVLILRDVVGWSASEVAEHLDVTVAAVTSALERARASMREQGAGGAPRPSGAAAEDGRTVALLSRYVDAWHAGDVEALLAVLHEDVVFTMPPLPLWYRGVAAVRGFLEGALFVGDAAERFRLLATAANGCPAFAAYQLHEDGVYRFGALQVLTIEHGRVVQIDDFLALSDRLVTAFELRRTL
jgi:RNA polymerase sigma-70 factor (ECF subfamily)